MSTLDVSFLAIHGPTRPCTDTQILHICRLILTSISSFKGKEQGRCDLLQSNLNICFICDTSTRNGFGVISCHFESHVLAVCVLLVPSQWQSTPSLCRIHWRCYIYQPFACTTSNCLTWPTQNLFLVMIKSMAETSSHRCSAGLLLLICSIHRNGLAYTPYDNYGNTCGNE